jgi:hypothetical protein
LSPAVKKAGSIDIPEAGIYFIEHSVIRGQMEASIMVVDHKKLESLKNDPTGQILKELYSTDEIAHYKGNGKLPEEYLAAEDF